MVSLPEQLLGVVFLPFTRAGAGCGVPTLYLHHTFLPVVQCLTPSPFTITMIGNIDVWL